MPVYVDSMFAPYRGMRMCHMVADTRAELLEMVDKIGVDRKWLQNKGTHREHFDIAASKRQLAISQGARIVSRRELGLILKKKREALCDVDRT